MSVDSSQRASAPAEVAEIVLAEVRLGMAEHLADQLTLDSRLGELGLDSLATMEAVNRIEAIFGIRFTEDSLYDIECCRDLVRCVEERLGRTERREFACAHRRGHWASGSRGKDG